MLQILLTISLFISSAAYGSFAYWQFGVGAGSSDYWEHGKAAGSRDFWLHGTTQGSLYYYNYNDGPGSAYFWQFGRAAGSKDYWEHGTGYGSRDFWLNGTGPGSMNYWKMGQQSSFPPTWIALCKGAALQIDMCTVLTSNISQLKSLLHSGLQRCSDPSDQSDLQDYYKPSPAQ